MCVYMNIYGQDISSVSAIKLTFCEIFTSHPGKTFYFEKDINPGEACEKDRPKRLAR